MDSGLVVALAAAVAAAITCVSWLREAAYGNRFAVRPSLALAGWGAVSSAGDGLFALGSPLGNGVTWAFFAAASLLAFYGMVGAARAVVVAGRLDSAIAEGALIGSSMVAVLWGLVGPPDPPSRVVPTLCMCIISLSVAATVLRALLASPSLVVDGRFRSVLLLSVAAAGSFAVAEVVSILQVCAQTPGGVAVIPALTDDSLLAAALTGVGLVLGHLASAATPWIRLSPVRPVGEPSLLVRGLPYGLVAAAVLAQAPAARRSALGPVTLTLVAAVVVGLLVVQVVALRENARLSTALEYSRARLAALVENAGDVILGLDASGRVIAANAAALVLLHRSPEVLVGQDVVEVAAANDRPRVRDVVLAVAGGELASARAELTLAAPAAGMVELRLRGVPGGAVANLSDVTESVQLRERLARLARFDQMTGLANRSLLKEQLGVWLDAGARVGVLYLDLDGFKAVNDRFGHLAGDAVLVEAARRLVDSSRRVLQRTVVARMGGDEFVIALENCGVHEAMGASTAVLEALHPTFDVDDRAVRIGASIGVAATDDGGHTRAGAAGADDLLHRADIAMFAAKESGRAQVRQWEAAVEERAMRKVDIAIGLRRALDTGRLALAYQPIVRLADGVIVGAEALIRLHPDDPVATPTTPMTALSPGTSGSVRASGAPGRTGTSGLSGSPGPPGLLEGLADLVSPAELVEVAEGTGEIDELGRWVLAEATHQAAIWQSLGVDVRVNVNMSVRQLSDPDFVGAVRGALVTAGLAPDRLVIEITEGQLIGEGDRANETIRRLRSDGVQLAIDDFGSGYSSLSYLRRMPIRTVKIDRTLLDGVGSDPRATTLVRAVIGAARGLGLLVVCEGIESLATARFLRDLGAWAGQGFALHAAMSSTTLLDVLQGPAVSLADPPGAGAWGRLRAVPPPAAGSTAQQAGPVHGPVSHHETAVGGD